MNIQAEKLELVRKILDTDNLGILSSIKQIFTSSKKVDFWDSLHKSQKEEILKGIEAARARGVNGGRPAGSYNKKKASAVVTLYKQKNSINFIEDNLNISRSTIYQYLRNEGVVIKGFKKVKNN